MPTTILRFLLPAVLLIAGTAMAQEPTPQQAPAPLHETAVPLTKKLIGRVVSAIEDMKSAGLVDTGEAEQRAHAKENIAKMNAIVTKHGFKSTDEFSTAANSVMQAYGALRMRETVGDAKKVEAEYKKSRKEIMDNKKLSENQKQEMLKTLEIRHKVLTSLPENKDAELVRPFKARLQKILEGTQKGS